MVNKMEQLSFFNLISAEGEYTTQTHPSGSKYYNCAKCKRLLRIDIGKQHLKDGESKTIYQRDICECGAVINW